MKILVLSGEIPATTNMPGSPRLFSLCRGLARRHELYLATRCSSTERHHALLSEPDASEVFPRMCVLPSPYPEPPTWWNRQRHRLHIGAFVQTRYLYPDYHRQIAATIRNIVATERVDLVYVDGLAMTQYVGSEARVPAVVDLHDSLTLLISRMVRVEPSLRRKLLLGVDRVAIARCERALHRSFALVITNSTIDEAEVRKLSPTANTLTIVNGVDSEFFFPRTTDQLAERLVFTGVMNYAPNEDAVVYFCNEIFPLVRARYPQAEFWIVGKDPTSAVRALSRYAGVHVTGGVPDIRPYLEKAGVFVCPLRYGAGIKNKILAALAMRKPVVATRVSLDGLDLTDDRELMVGEGAEDFADKVASLLQNPARGQALAEAGRTMVTLNYSWHASAKQLNEALEAVVARP